MYAHTCGSQWTAFGVVLQELATLFKIGYLTGLEASWPASARDPLLSASLVMDGFTSTPPHGHFSHEF